MKNITRFCLDFGGVISDPRKLKTDLSLPEYGYIMTRENSKRDTAVDHYKLTEFQYQELVKVV